MVQQGCVVRGSRPIRSQDPFTQCSQDPYSQRVEEVIDTLLYVHVCLAIGEGRSRGHGL